jgi:hypothetical protein
MRRAFSRCAQHKRNRVQTRRPGGVARGRSIRIAPLRRFAAGRDQNVPGGFSVDPPPAPVAHSALS